MENFIVGSTFKSTTNPGYTLTITECTTHFGCTGLRRGADPGAMFYIATLKEATEHFETGLFYDLQEPVNITPVEKSLLQTALQALRNTFLLAIILFSLMAIFFSCCTPVHYVYTPSAVRIEGKTYVRFQRSEFIVRKGDTILLLKKQIR